MGKILRWGLQQLCQSFIDICIHVSSLSHPDISESNNTVDLIGYWCHHKFEAKIHGGPISLIVFMHPLSELAF